MQKHLAVFMTTFALMLFAFEGTAVGTAVGAASASTPILNKNYVTITYGCSDPTFQYTPEEQQMRDAMEHVGPYPWMTDIIQFHSQTEGTHTVRWHESRGNWCDSISAFTYQIANGQISIHYTKTESQPHSQNPDDSEISCSSDGSDDADYLISFARDTMTLGFENKLCQGAYGFVFQLEHP
mgnify:CR=1 FL=1